jgi:hypothetical protein
MIFLVTPDSFDDLHPDLDLALPTPPAMVLLSIGVADIGQAAAVLETNGVRAGRKGGHLAIHPDDVLGMGLEFISV